MQLEPINNCVHIWAAICDRHTGIAPLHPVRVPLAKAAFTVLLNFWEFPDKNQVIWKFVF